MGRCSPAARGEGEVPVLCLPRKKALPSLWGPLHAKRKATGRLPHTAHHGNWAWRKRGRADGQSSALPSLVTPASHTLLLSAEVSCKVSPWQPPDLLSQLLNEGDITMLCWLPLELLKASSWHSTKSGIFDLLTRLVPWRGGTSKRSSYSWGGPWGQQEGCRRAGGSSSASMDQAVCGVVLQL